jgi:Protein of unknown function (DUF1428)
MQAPAIVLGPTVNKETEMPYVDGFVTPVKKDKVEVYKAHAKKAGEVWMEPVERI